MSKSKDYNNRLELLKKYFKDESLETIQSDWNKLNNQEFGGISIGEFLNDNSAEQNLFTNYALDEVPNFPYYATYKEASSEYFDKAYLSYSGFLQDGIEELKQTTLDQHYTTTDKEETNERSFAMAA